MSILLLHFGDGKKLIPRYSQPILQNFHARFVFSKWKLRIDLVPKLLAKPIHIMRAGTIAQMVKCEDGYINTIDQVKFININLTEISVLYQLHLLLLIRDTHNCWGAVQDIIWTFPSYFTW